MAFSIFSGQYAGIDYSTHELVGTAPVDSSPYEWEIKNGSGVVIANQTTPNGWALDLYWLEICAPDGATPGTYTGRSLYAFDWEMPIYETTWTCTVVVPRQVPRNSVQTGTILRQTSSTYPFPPTPDSESWFVSYPTCIRNSSTHAGYYVLNGAAEKNGWEVLNDTITIPANAALGKYSVSYVKAVGSTGATVAYSLAIDVVCMEVTISIGEGEWDAEAGKWTYTATANVEGGTGPFNYSWDSGGTNSTEDYVIDPEAIITPTCTVTDTGRGNCTDTNSGYKKADVEPGWYCIGNTGCVYVGVTNQHLVTNITGGPFPTFGSCIGACNPVGPYCPDGWLMEDGHCVWYGEGSPPADPPPSPQCGEGFVIVDDECVPTGGSGSGSGGGTGSGSGSSSGSGTGSGTGNGSGFPDAGYYCVTKESTAAEVLAVLSSNGISASSVDGKICFSKGEHSREFIEELLSEEGLTWRLE